MIGGRRPGSRIISGVGLEGRRGLDSYTAVVLSTSAPKIIVSMAHP